MNNFVIGFKRFITNKNVVSILGVLLILGLLFWGYSSTIKKEVAPINIPVAKETIGPLTEITNSHITFKKVSGGITGESIIINQAYIVGKYTNVNVTIPKDGFFYTELLADKDDVKGVWIEQLDREKDEHPYYMSVNNDITLGNSILPYSYVDIYMRAEDENGTPMFGKLLENIHVLVVHDGSGNNVFKGNTSSASAAKIGFGVSRELYLLLWKAEYLNINLRIVPRGIEIPKDDAISVKSSTLRDYIDSQTITIEDDAIIEETEENVNDNNTEDDTNNADDVTNNTDNNNNINNN